MASWATDTALRTGRAVQAARKKKGWTAGRLSKEAAALGFPIHRVAIGKLENGHRGAKFDVTELVVLAKCLGVPPATLLYPLADDSDVEVLPGVRTTPRAAAEWLGGYTAFRYYNEAGDFVADREEYEVGAAVLIALRDEEEQRRQLLDALSLRDRYAVEKGAQHSETLVVAHAVRVTGERLRDVRTELRVLGHEPPALPAELAYVDGDES